VIDLMLVTKPTAGRRAGRSHRLVCPVNNSLIAFACRTRWCPSITNVGSSPALQTSDHRGGRGLPVGTGDGDLSATRRRGRERLRPSPGRDPATARLDQLGVVVTDRGGDDDRVRVAEVAHVVTHGDRGAEGP
jgi:hypothetical protein